MIPVLGLKLKPTTALFAQLRGKIISSFSPGKVFPYNDIHVEVSMVATAEYRRVTDFPHEFLVKQMIEHLLNYGVFIRHGEEDVGLIEVCHQKEMAILDEQVAQLVIDHGNDRGLLISMVDRNMTTSLVERHNRTKPLKEFTHYHAVLQSLARVDYAAQRNPIPVVQTLVKATDMSTTPLNTKVPSESESLDKLILLLTPADKSIVAFQPKPSKALFDLVQENGLVSDIDRNWFEKRLESLADRGLIRMSISVDGPVYVNLVEQKPVVEDDHLDMVIMSSLKNDESSISQAVRRVPLPLLFDMVSNILSSHVVTFDHYKNRIDMMSYAGKIQLTVGPNDTTMVSLQIEKTLPPMPDQDLDKLILSMLKDGKSIATFNPNRQVDVSYALFDLVKAGTIFHVISVDKFNERIWTLAQNGKIEVARDANDRFWVTLAKPTIKPVETLTAELDLNKIMIAIALQQVKRQKEAAHENFHHVWDYLINLVEADGVAFKVRYPIVSAELNLTLVGFNLPVSREVAQLAMASFPEE